MTELRPRTVGELKATGYRPRTVKEEMRANLVRKLRGEEALFPGVQGYEDTVIPQIVNAVLSRHDFILLGLRGQAKSSSSRAGTRTKNSPAMIAACTLRAPAETTRATHTRPNRYPKLAW